MYKLLQNIPFFCHYDCADKLEKIRKKSVLVCFANACCIESDFFFSKNLVAVYLFKNRSFTLPYPVISLISL